MVDINIYDKDLKDMTLGEAYRMLLLKTGQVDHSSHVKKELSRKMIKLVRMSHDLYPDSHNDHDDKVTHFLTELYFALADMIENKEYVIISPLSNDGRSEDGVSYSLHRNNKMVCKITDHLSMKDLHGWLVEIENGKCKIAVTVNEDNYLFKVFCEGEHHWKITSDDFTLLVVKPFCIKVDHVLRAVTDHLLIDYC
jgi:hypothetical protein|nr:MAG TPA: hypothetical protein [Caudoviricetes sp.]